MFNVTLRPAQPGDKAAITVLASKIWDGEDYLPYSFDDWVAQERGRFIVAYAGKQLVGCNKLTESRPGEWWMEGLRVDPDWRGKGIARLLHENIIKIAAEIASAENQTGILRLATNSKNKAVHKLAFNTGFDHTSSHCLYRADVPEGDSTALLPFTAVQPSEKAQVESWFNRSATFAAVHGLFEEGWEWYEIWPRLDELVEDGRLYWWQPGSSGVAPANGLVIVHQRDAETLALNYADTDSRQWVQMMNDVRLFGRKFGVSQIESKPLASDEIREALPFPAWEVEYDLELWVFQRPIG
ncbi:MAG: GNAT family N-acetyltransferase [Candidatus Promineifilaceae bacterium]